MGSSAAMDSVDLVLKKHGKEIRRELFAEYKAASKGLVTDVILENGMYWISVSAVLKNGGKLNMASIDIDDLAEKYPDCEVGY